MKQTFPRQLRVDLWCRPSWCALLVQGRTLAFLRRKYLQENHNLIKKKKSWNLPRTIGNKNHMRRLIHLTSVVRPTHNAVEKILRLVAFNEFMETIKDCFRGECGEKKIIINKSATNRQWDNRMMPVDQQGKTCWSTLMQSRTSWRFSSTATASSCRDLVVSWARTTRSRTMLGWCCWTKGWSQ